MPVAEPPVVDRGAAAGGCDESEREREGAGGRSLHRNGAPEAANMREYQTSYGRVRRIVRHVDARIRGEQPPMMRSMGNDGPGKEKIQLRGYYNDGRRARRESCEVFEERQVYVVQVQQICPGSPCGNSDGMAQAPGETLFGLSHM